LDLRQEFLKKKIVITAFPVGRVDEEPYASFGSHHNKVADLVRSMKVFDQSPSAAAHKRLFVFAQPVQEVEDGILFCSLGIVRRKHHAIVHGTMQKSAVKRAALDATLGGGVGCGEKHRREKQQLTHDEFLAKVIHHQVRNHHEGICATIVISFGY